VLETLDFVVKEIEELRQKIQVQIIDNGKYELILPIVDSDFVEFTYLKNKKNIGLSGSFQKAFTKSTALYTWILSDDDHLIKGCVKTVFEECKNVEISAFAFKSLEKNGVIKIFKEESSVKKVNGNEILNGAFLNFIMLSVNCFRTELAKSQLKKNCELNLFNHTYPQILLLLGLIKGNNQFALGNIPIVVDSRVEKHYSARSAFAVRLRDVVLLNYSARRLKLEKESLIFLNKWIKSHIINYGIRHHIEFREFKDKRELIKMNLWIGVRIRDLGIFIVWLATLITQAIFIFRSRPSKILLKYLHVSGQIKPFEDVLLKEYTSFKSEYPNYDPQN
jgi:hypothetical protein